MRPIFYEMKKTVMNWKFITVVAILVLFTVLLFYNSITPRSQAGQYVSDSNAIFQENNTYHFDNFIFNGFGKPVANVQVLITLENGNTYQNIETWKTATNEAGYANISFPYSLAPGSSSIPYPSYTFMVNVSAGQDRSPFYLNFVGGNITNSNPVGPEESYSMVQMTNPENLYVPNFMIQYMSYSGNKSPPINLYYYYPNAQEYYSGSTINSSYVKIGTYSGFNTLLIKPHLRSDSTNVIIAITQNGSYIIMDSVSMQYISPTSQTFENIYFTGIAPIAIFMMSIAGVVGGYVSFGKDRATGVLDNVLARPIKRSNIIVSRYTASGSIIVIMSFIVGFVDYLLVSYQYGVLLPADFVLIIGGGLAVTSMAFLSLTFLFSNMTKSTGTLMAVSILILVFYIFAWQVLQGILPYALHLSFSSHAFIQLQLILNMLSPLNFSSLTYSLLTAGISESGTIAAITFESVGLNWTSLGIYGFLWIFLPITGAFFMYRNRD